MAQPTDSATKQVLADDALSVFGYAYAYAFAWRFS
jgi:hypothetical protein